MFSKQNGKSRFQLLLLKFRIDCLRVCSRCQLGFGLGNHAIHPSRYLSSNCSVNAHQSASAAREGNVWYLNDEFLQTIDSQGTTELLTICLGNTAKFVCQHEQEDAIRIAEYREAKIPSGCSASKSPKLTFSC